MRNKVIGTIASMLLVVSLLVGLVACAQPAPTPTTPTTPTAPAQPEILKIGVDCGQNYPQGLDLLKLLGVEDAQMKKDGGLDIGGKKVQIEFIYDDNKLDQALVKTAAQKEIFQDKCKYIISDDFASVIYNMCDENEVVLVTTSMDDDLRDPRHTWVWGAGAGYVLFPGTIIYVAQQFPNLKTYQGVFPDRRDGHIAAELEQKFAEAAGLTLFPDMFYPTTATDLSALGTKIKQENPDFLVPFQGGPALDAAVMKAAHSAGWRGQLICMATMPGELILGIAGAEALEGLIGLAWPAEFEPATTPEGAAFKAGYIDMYGKWDCPEIVLAPCWYSIKGALQQAGSTDPAKIKELLDGKMGPVDCPNGTLVRVPRPDFGNPRAVDVVIGNVPTKKIVGGKIEYFGAFTVEQQLNYAKMVFGE